MDAFLKLVILRENTEQSLLEFRVFLGCDAVSLGRVVCDISKDHYVFSSWGLIGLFGLEHEANTIFQNVRNCSLARHCATSQRA
jgi:hypothetical protein